MLQDGRAAHALNGEGFKGTESNAPRVAVVVLNWNGWSDTVACLESLFASTYSNFRVIVCDNASTDGSTERLLAWAQADARRGNGPSHVSEAWWPSNRSVASVPAETRSLLVLHTGGNRGFAGGNNVGMRTAFADPEVDYVWLLNNDTTVDRDAIAELVAVAGAAGPDVLASAQIRCMEQPSTVWFEGGEYSAWSATARHVCVDRFTATARPYLTGCALLISRGAVKRLGFLDETIFMYGEDVDYSARATSAGVPLVVAPRSVVLHAGGASSGNASAFAYRHHVANVIRVITRHQGRGRLLTIVPFHLAKALALFAVRHQSRLLLRAYLQGVRNGISGR